VHQPLRTILTNVAVKKGCFAEATVSRTFWICIDSAMRGWTNRHSRRTKVVTGSSNPLRSNNNCAVSLCSCGFGSLPSNCGAIEWTSVTVRIIWPITLLYHQSFAMGLIRYSLHISSPTVKCWIPRSSASHLKKILDVETAKRYCAALPLTGRT